MKRKKRRKNVESKKKLRERINYYEREKIVKKKNVGEKKIKFIKNYRYLVFKRASFQDKLSQELTV